MQWRVASEESGQKLQDFLYVKLEGQFSKKKIARMVEAKLCLIDNVVERFAQAPVFSGNIITLTLPVGEQKPQPFTILYEDATLIAYNKPAYIEALPSHLPHHHMVHRLDRETSGVWLWVKEAQSAPLIEKLFKNRLMHKHYLAIVDRAVVDNEGEINNTIGPVHQYQGQVVWGASAAPTAKQAITYWKVLSRSAQASLLLCSPLTGRTHQIRVHLSGMGHPILGDAQYGKTFLCPYKPLRHQLHAYQLEFIHPITQKKVEIKAPIPDDFRETLKQLGLQCAY